MSRETSRGDEELSREFVRQVLAAGRETCRHIAEGVRITADRQFAFPVNDDVSFEVSVAILGTALAVLKGYSQMMTADRGSRIEVFCKRSLRRDYGLPGDSADNVDEALDAYQSIFVKAIADNKNPFGETFGSMLVKCLGPSVSALCIDHTSVLNPSVHMVVGMLAETTLRQVLSFWR
jgi:hypothetical protein